MHHDPKRKLMKISNSIDLLDWFKATVDVESDYMVAKLTGKTTQYISQVRCGRSEFGDFYALELACIAKHPDPMKVVASIQACKAEKQGKHEEAKKWREYAA